MRILDAGRILVFRLICSTNLFSSLAFQIWEIDLKPFDTGPNWCLASFRRECSSSVRFQICSHLVRGGVLNAGPHPRVSVRIWNVGI